MDTKDSKRRVDLDTILIEEIGQFSKFQLRTLMLAMGLAVFVSWAGTEYIFTTARISTRCVIPECDGAEPEWSPYWLANAVPATSDTSFDNCQRFGNTSASQRLVDSNTCPSTLFNRNTLQPCEDYVYENTYSVAYDFGLACNDWARSLIGTIRTVGVIIGFPLVGYISDRWGRRVALTITGINAAWLGIVRYWADTYVGFTVSQFVEAALGSGSYTSAYILVLELVGPKYRVVAGAFMNTAHSVGSILMALIAWGLPYWRHLTLALYVPQLLILAYYWLMPESVRWYMSKGRFEDAEIVLKKAAQVNGRQLSEQSLEELRQITIEAANKKVLEGTSDTEWLIVTLFKHKRVLLRCCVAPIWWITSTFIFYGLSINAVNMSGNRYLNYVFVSAVEIPGFWISVFLLSRIGRKKVLIIAFWLCAACQIAYIFLPQDMYGLSLTVYLIAKFSIAMEVVAVYVYTAELYPTVKRQSLFNFTSMVGRIGSMLAPLTPAFGAQWFEELPFALFAFMGLLSGALIFLTPETLGAKLPDTFEQADALGRKNNSTESVR